MGSMKKRADTIAADINSEPALNSCELPTVQDGILLVEIWKRLSMLWNICLILRTWRMDN